MVKLSSLNLTLAEFLKLPETKPVSEYINGQIIQKPMSQGKHSTIQGELVTSINTLAKEKKTAKAFPELRCNFGGRSIVPDDAVFSWEHIPVDENGDVANAFAVAPDWTIEIISPDKARQK
jgi:Uma2 family endonuclease